MSFTFVQSQLLLGAIGANFAHGTHACVLDAVQWPLKIMAQQKSSAIFGEMLTVMAHDRGRLVGATHISCFQTDVW